MDIFLSIIGLVFKVVFWLSVTLGMLMFFLQKIQGADEKTQLKTASFLVIIFFTGILYLKGESYREKPQKERKVKTPTTLTAQRR